MKLVVASDEKTPLTDEVIAYLRQHGHELVLMGHLVEEDKKWQWADIGKAAARLVANNHAEQGVVQRASAELFIFCSDLSLGSGDGGKRYGIQDERRRNP